MNGYEYEEYCASYLKSCGFIDVNITPASGDQGIDILATKNGEKYGIQCKYYSGAVGNKAIQEAYAGAAFYHCDVAVVMTNSTFTTAAENLARETGVILWDGIAVKSSTTHEPLKPSRPCRAIGGLFAIIGMMTLITSQGGNSLLWNSFVVVVFLFMAFLLLLFNTKPIALKLCSVTWIIYMTFEITMYKEFTIHSLILLLSMPLFLGYRLRKIARDFDS